MIFRNRSLMGAAMCLLLLIIFLLAQANKGSFASILTTSPLKDRPQAALTQLTTHIVLFKFKDGVASADLKDVRDLASIVPALLTRCTDHPADAQPTKVVHTP